MNFSNIPSNSALGWLLRLPLRLLPPSLVVRIAQGPLRGWRWTIGAATHGCWLGSYEFAKLQEFTNVLQRGDVVYDVGANVGYYSLAAARVVGTHGRVYAFEPVERNLDYLRQHIALNKCSNIEIVPFAVAQKPGTRHFSVGVSPSEGHLEAMGGITVDVVSLDSITESGAIRPPDVIKIDAEGAETEVLMGAEQVVAMSEPVIFVATHSAGAHEFCVAWLGKHDYRIHGVGGVPVESCDELVAVIDLPTKAAPMGLERSLS